MIKHQRKLDLIALLFAVLALAGCTSLFRGVVTLTEVVHAAERQYAVVYKQGLVSEDAHARITRAHEEYRAAARTGADALRAYKASGDSADYVRALEVAKVAATAFIDRIVPLLTADRGTKLKADLVRAHEL